MNKLGLFLAVAMSCAVVPHAADRAPGDLLFEDDFSNDLAGWIVGGAHGVEIRESGDPDHAEVLELRANGDGVFVLARGSQD